MLSDRDLELAASQLTEYRRQNALPGILDKYSTLIEDYRRLRSDFEEEREAREKYKQMARGHDRNPFVAVLVDGDGYIFHERLYTKGDTNNGGSQAAQVLDETIRASLRAKHLEHCEVVIKIYANVNELSRTLCRVGLTGADKRSLAPFIANFNRSYGLADFVDAGDIKENAADIKLRALLKHYAENTQCKHIYFAGCHNAGYVSDLVPYAGKSKSRFTLIKSSGVKFHDEFTKLGLGLEELPGVFRSTPLEDYTSTTSNSYRPSTTNASLTRSPSVGAPTPPLGDTASMRGERVDRRDRGDGPRPICRFYPSGRCKYGKTCKNMHIDDAASSKLSWRATTNDPQAAAAGSDSRRRQSPLLGTFSDPATDLENGHSSQGQAKESLMAWLDVFELPKKADMPAGHVAVNKNGFRLDPYVPQPSYDTLHRLRNQANQQHVCNDFHLNGFCKSGNDCTYDHTPLDETSLQAVESLARTMPCPQRGECRRANCTRGHVCQKVDCKHRGGRANCRLPMQAHNEDLAISSYVPASNQPFSAVVSASASTIDEDDDPMVASLLPTGDTATESVGSITPHDEIELIETGSNLW